MRHAAFDALVNALFDTTAGCEIHGGKRALPESAALSLVQVLDDADARAACLGTNHVTMGGGHNGSRTSLTSKLARLVDSGAIDRYVLSYSLEALRRLADGDGDNEARRVLLDALMASRWCSHTNMDSPY